MLRGFDAWLTTDPNADAPEFCGLCLEGPDECVCPPCPRPDCYEVQGDPLCYERGHLAPSLAAAMRRAYNEWKWDQENRRTCEAEAGLDLFRDLYYFP